MKKSAKRRKDADESTKLAEAAERRGDPVTAKEYWLDAEQAERDAETLEADGE